jgi:hypothetical protein
MKTTNKDCYIVYNDAFIIVKTFQYWGKAIMNYLDQNPSFYWVNTTHPAHKKTIEYINEANYTNY